MGLFDFFYRVIILNTLFLVTNAFFFQVYFLFDFKSKIIIVKSFHLENIYKQESQVE